MRSAGVLMPVFSLPGPFGIGVFGQEAYDFIDRIAEMGFRYWQLLPFTIVDEWNSPYSSISAFAGNDLFIDPRQLQEEGLLSETEVRESIYPGTPYIADYSFAREKRLTVLRKAFARLDRESVKELEDFAEEWPWLSDFAHFMCLQKKYDDAPWWEWPENARKETVEQTELFFWIFVQHVFLKQWQKVKDYGNRKGISFIGDMPIYPSVNSCDVWANEHLFQMDPNTHRPVQIAGVPPDYFSEKGQLWGNPLYDWAQMKKDHYHWWKERFEHLFSMFDMVRIDHFRAFASYWAVPLDAESAAEGHWEKGPGISLFHALDQRWKNKIIAEDLGSYGKDVVALLAETGFPGMRVIQFGFTPGSDSVHLPHHYPFRSVAYIGTHDNSTLLGWLWESKPEEREYILRYCGFHGNDWGRGGYDSPSCRCIIETLWKSSADTAIIPVQDMCGFGNDARINVPGTEKDNWRFRMTKENLEQIDREYFQSINLLYGRK